MGGDGSENEEGLEGEEHLFEREEEVGLGWKGRKGGRRTGLFEKRTTRRKSEGQFERGQAQKERETHKEGDGMNEGGKVEDFAGKSRRGRRRRWK